MVDELRFDLCEDLKKLDTVTDVDQVRCVSATSAHLLIYIERYSVLKWVKSMSHKNEQERG
jgi:hypothetical protein